MVNTRSKTRRTQSPLGRSPHTPPHSRRSPPRKRQRLATPAPLRTFCQHGPRGLCTCGSDFRPLDPAAYTTGKAPASNAVSETFLQENLGITAAELTYVICLSMALKDALVRVCEGEGEARVEHVDGTKWRVVVDGTPIAWLARAAEHLAQQNVVSSPIGDNNPIPEEQSVHDEQSIPGDIYTPVDTSIVNLQTGRIDLKTTLGRGWVCAALVPAVMLILQQDSSSHSGLYAKLMRAEDPSTGVRAYLLYQAVKAGLGNITMRKHDAWGRVLSERAVQKMGRRIELLELAKTLAEVRNEVDAEDQMKDSEVEKLKLEVQELRGMQEKGYVDPTVVTGLVRRVEENYQESKAEIAKVENDVRIQETNHSAQIANIESDFRILQTTQATDIVRIEHDIESLTTKQVTDIATLSTDLHGTLSLLTTDQLETRAWMKEAVDDIRSSLSSTKSPPPPPPPPIPGPPLLFLRIRNPHGHDIPAPESFTRVYSLGESTFAVARGLLRPFCTPFLIAVMGYSNAGKSYTILGEDGIIAAVLGRLAGTAAHGGIDVKVCQVLQTAEAIGEYAYPTHSVAHILSSIDKSRTTAATPANGTSSRAHIIVTFESDAGVLGCIVDVAGAEESANRDLLDPEMKRTSAAIAVENGEFRKLLVELGKQGKRGFVSRNVVSEVKRTCALNWEVSRFLRCCKGEPAVRVLLCIDGSRPDMFARAMTLVPEFVRAEEEEGDVAMGGV